MAITGLLEDFEVGETWTSRKETITEDSIIAFAKANDPQSIHADPVAAAKGRFGTVIASGWQIAALSLRLFVEANGETPIVGIGIDELRWKQIVRPGDVLQVHRTVIEVRRSLSRPDRGIVKSRVEVKNQNGEVVLSMIGLGQVPARTTGHSAAPDDLRPASTRDDALDPLDQMISDHSDPKSSR